MFKISLNNDVASIVFLKINSSNFNKIPSELSSNKVLFKFENNKLEFTNSGNHYILE